MSIIQRKLRGEREEIARKVSREVVNLTDEELESAHALTTQISNAFNARISSTQGFDAYLRREIEGMVQSQVEKLDCGIESQQRIAKYVISNVTGYGPIQEFIDDKDVREILVQRFNNICIERRCGDNGERSERVSVDEKFSSEQHLRTIIDRIIQPLGRQINYTHPKVDARLDDGSRVNATVPPMSPDGATLTIRKFPDQILNGKDYLHMGSLSREMLYFLLKSVEAKVSIIASGGTRAGKTSLLNMLSLAIPSDEMIITIEDPCELRLSQPNVRRLEANMDADSGNNAMPITIQMCVKNSLRMAPDRIVVGEVRDGAIVDMLTAMSTGHDGSLSTIHANSPQNLVTSRLPLLFAQNENHFSEREQRIMFCAAVELIVQISLMPDGSRKVTSVCEVGENLDQNGNAELKDIFVYDEKKESFIPTGYRPERILDKFQRRKISFDENIFKVKEKGEPT